MNSLETYFTVENGKIHYPELEKYKKALSTLVDGRYLNKVEKIYNHRSLEQNNALFGIPYQYFKRALHEAGIYKEPTTLQVHEWCMHHCLPEDYKERIYNEWTETKGIIDIRTGEEIKPAFRLTSTKMTTVDAMHYYENMQQFYSEWFSSGNEGDTIPDPDPKMKRGAGSKKKKQQFFNV